MGELCQINGEKIQGEMGAKQKNRAVTDWFFV